MDYRDAKTYQIGGIEIEGADYNDKNAIIAVSGLTVDQKVKLPGPKVTKAIRNLWKMRLFTDVQIYVTKTIEDVAFLTIKVQERPRLSRYSYRGVKKGLHDDLNGKVQRFLLRGGIVTESVKLNANNALKDYFIDKGFLDTEVDVIEIKDSLLVNSVRLVFDIDKGKKIKIKEIEINGNDAVAAKKVRKKMKGTKQMKALFKASKYIEDDYEDDLVAIINPL